MLQKYWDGLSDFYNGRKENGIAIVDTSGSMYGTPLEAAVSMGAYIADKAHGPFANHFITFSSAPQLIEFSGVDIVDKFKRCRRADWGANTNLKAVFDMLLRTARNRHVKPEDMPTQTLYLSVIWSLMRCVTFNRKSRTSLIMVNSMEKRDRSISIDEVNSDLENTKKEWARHGYQLPQVIFLES